MHQHDFGVTGLVLEHAPDRQGRGVIFLLFCIGSVQRGQNIVKTGKLVLVPPLPVLFPNNSAASGGRVLLVLASPSIGTLIPFYFLAYFLRKPLRPSQFLIFCAVVLPEDVLFRK